MWGNRIGRIAAIGDSKCDSQGEPAARRTAGVTSFSPELAVGHQVKLRDVPPVRLGDTQKFGLVTPLSISCFQVNQALDCAVFIDPYRQLFEFVWLPMRWLAASVVDQMKTKNSCR